MDRRGVSYFRWGILQNAPPPPTKPSSKLPFPSNESEEWFPYNLMWISPVVLLGKRDAESLHWNSHLGTRPPQPVFLLMAWLISEGIVRAVLATRNQINSKSINCFISPLPNIVGLKCLNISWLETDLLTDWREDCEIYCQLLKTVRKMYV